MEQLEEVNKRLLENYGRGVAEQPLYRVVWSTSQIERRYGTFIKETEAGLFLGYETCERDVPKYPFHQNYWILEWVQPNIGNPELLAPWSYEPLRVFRDKLHNPLPYDWEVIEEIIKRQQARVIYKNQAMVDAEEAERIQKETEENLEILKGQRDAFYGKLHNHEGVVLDKTDYWIREK